MSKKYFIVVLVAVVFLMNFRMVGAAAPLTGTFFLGEIALTYSEMGQMMDEWKSMGIDTVVTMGSGSLKKINGVYVEDDWFAHQHAYSDIVKLAAMRNMKVFVGTVAIDAGVNINPLSQTDTAAFADRARAYDFSKRLVTSMKTFCQNNNISWETIAGFYIATESPVGGDWAYQRELASALKSVAPEKKTMMAPYVNPSTDQFNVNDSYRYVYNIGKDVYANSDVDILAPQDSLGTGKAANFLEAETMYRALKDGLRDSGKTNKELWADVETFEFLNPVAGGESRAAPFARVQQQIETWKPYVTKEISWLYQQNMQQGPAVFDNFGRTWNPEYTYTPDNASKRAVLRAAYMNAYGIINVVLPTVGAQKNMYYCPIGGGTCGSTTSQYFDTTTCANNLNAYMTGLSTGVCYETADSCNSACVVPTKVLLSGDYDGNGVVNLVDFGIWKSKYLAVPPTATLIDFGTWKRAYLNPATSTVVPTVAPTAVPPTAVPTVKVPAATFGDVPMGHWAFNAIDIISKNNVMTGCAAGSFCPDTPLTRAQAAVVLLRAEHGGGHSPPKATAAVFNDVPVGYWAIDWINEAAGEGLFTGAGGAFRPEGSLTRAEAAVVLLKAAHGASFNLPAASNYFSDTGGHWAAQWIDELYREIGSSCLANPLSFCPDQTLTRDQGAVMIVNMFKLQ